MAIYDRVEAVAERTRREWSITDVAERSAIDVRYLQDFERGQRWLPPSYAERLDMVLRSDSMPALQPHDRDQASAERVRVGLSLTDLAARSGIDVGYLSDFEQGRRWLPPNYATRLEAALR